MGDNWHILPLHPSLRCAGIVCYDLPAIDRVLVLSQINFMSAEINLDKAPHQQSGGLARHAVVLRAAFFVNKRHEGMTRFSGDFSGFNRFSRQP
jgi:hypothetical protein